MTTRIRKPKPLVPRVGDIIRIRRDQPEGKYKAGCRAKLVERYTGYGSGHETMWYADFSNMNNLKGTWGPGDSWRGTGVHLIPSSRHGCWVVEQRAADAGTP